MSFNYKRCEDFVDDMRRLILAGIPDDPRAREGLGGGVDPTVDEVLDVVRESGITMGDFIELDERPGRFDERYRQNGWHRLLRVARNGDNDLFDILNRTGDYAE